MRPRGAIAFGVAPPESQTGYTGGGKNDDAPT